MPAQILESKVANAQFGRLWVGGRVTLTEQVVRYSPNALNKIVHAALGGVDVVRVDLRRISSVEVEQGHVTNIITVADHNGALRFRCYGAEAFAARIRRAADEAKRRGASANAPVPESS